MGIQRLLMDLLLEGQENEVGSGLGPSVPVCSQGGSIMLCFSHVYIG